MGPDVDPLWLALDEARCRAGPDLTHRLATPPWESTDPQVAAAWAALTAPDNFDRLSERLETALNPTARRATENALEECIRRLRASPSEMLGRLVACLDGVTGAGQLAFRHPELAGVPRLVVESAWPPHTRYIQFTPLEATSPYEFGLLWGQFSQGRAEGDFDARSLGSLAYCKACVEAWLVQGCDWKAFPRFEQVVPK